MPQTLKGLFSLEASGKIGGHRRPVRNRIPQPEPEEMEILAFRIKTTPTQAAATVDVNSASYIWLGGMFVWVPFDLAQYNRFRITGRGQANAAGQTITVQASYDTAGAQPLATGGNDVVITNTFGNFDSGVRTIASPPAVFTQVLILLKGSNATVDFFQSSFDILFWKV